MSFLETATLIQDRLLADTALAGQAVLVDEQKDIQSQIDQKIEKLGGCVVIHFDGFVVLDKNASTPRLGARYTLDVWSVPILAEESAMPAAEVMAAVIRRLWHWVPDGGHAFGEVQIGNGGLVPNRTYLVYDLEVVIPLHL